MYAQANSYNQYADYAEVIPFASEVPSSYIDANDLAEVLESYFQGALNNVDEYLPRLYRDLYELHPSNSLFGQLDEKELTQCLYKLTKLERAAIEYKFTQSRKSEILLNHAYLQDSTTSRFDSWVEQLYIEAVEMLSYEVLEILD